MVVNKEIRNVPHNEENEEPLFEDEIDDDNLSKFTDIKSLDPIIYSNIKWFIGFYGPSEQLYKQYLVESLKEAEDVRMKYIRMLLDYWFKIRAKL